MFIGAGRSDGEQFLFIHLGNILQIQFKKTFASITQYRSNHAMIDA
jgi:hypothetical protein